MGHISLHRDGILRIREAAKNPDTSKYIGATIPFRTWSRGQPLEFLSFIHEPFTMEDGLTVKELFLNLQIVGDQIQYLAGMDFSAFFEASQQSTNPNNDLSYIEVNGYMKIQNVPAYERSSNPNKEKNIFRIGKAKITNRYSVDIHWDSNAVLKEMRIQDGYEVRKVGIDLSPMSEWAHLPIVIKNKIKLVDESYHQRHTDFKESVTNPNHPLFDDQIGANNKVYSKSLEIDYTPTFHEAIILGCLNEWSFFGTPSAAVQVRDDLVQQMADMDKWIEENPDYKKDIEKLDKDEIPVIGPDIREEVKNREDQRDREIFKIFKSMIESDPDSIIK